jgi:hypothetical protein
LEDVAVTDLPSSEKETLIVEVQEYVANAELVATKQNNKAKIKRKIKRFIINSYKSTKGNNSFPSNIPKRSKLVNPLNKKKDN